jgi:hypothetical protein
MAAPSVATIVGEATRNATEPTYRAARAQARCAGAATSWLTQSKQSVAAPEPRAGDRASQGVKALPEREILEDESVMPAAGQHQRPDEAGVMPARADSVVLRVQNQL